MKNLTPKKILVLLLILSLLIISYLLGRNPVVLESKKSLEQILILSPTNIPSTSHTPTKLLMSPPPVSATISIVKNNTSEKHLGCDSNGRCLLIDGQGSNDCSNDRHCKHAECVNDLCSLVNGKGNDNCTPGVGFVDKNYIPYDTGCSHTACNNAKCELVPGKGNSECQLDSECMHAECKDLSCVSVMGKGENQCAFVNTYSVEGVSFNSSCAHADCEGTRCVLIPGGGVSKCSEHADCNR